MKTWNTSASWHRRNPISIEKHGEEPSRQALQIEGRFTIIELLVVVAIIGILFSILLPALVGAKESAKGTHCLNTQKQLYIAIVGVAEDSNHGRWLPYRDPHRDSVGHERYTPEVRDRYWSEMIRVQFYQGSSTWRKLSEPEPGRYDQTDNEADGGAKLICPSDTAYHEATPTTDWYWVHSDSFSKYSSYGINIDAFGLEYGGSVKLGGLLYPSKTLLLTESQLYACHCAPGKALGRTISHPSSPVLETRHVGKANSLFGDGHVQQCKAEDLYYPLVRGYATDEQDQLWYGE